MKSIKSIVSLSALVVCMGAASMANAFSFSPVGTAFTAAGTISVKSPSSYQAQVDCTINFVGTTDSDGKPKITNVTVSGSNVLCSKPIITGLSWVMKATSLTTFEVANVGYNIAAIPLLAPATTCGPNTVDGVWTPPAGTTGGKIKLTNKALTGTGTPNTGNCTIVDLSVTVSPNTIVITNP